MAYGGGFLGGLSEFAGGMAQGIERGKKLKMEEEAAARDEERMARERKGWAREDKLTALLENTPKVGDVIGARSNPLFVGQSQEDAEGFVGSYNPQGTTMGQAPVPQVGLPDTAPQASPQASLPPAAAPQAGLPVPAPQAQMPSAAPTAALPPMTKGATFEETFAPFQRSETPAPEAQAAPAQAAQPNAAPKLITYFDPLRKTYNVVSEADARRANEADVAAYEVAAYRAVGDVKSARALERDALEMINLRSDVNRKRALTVLDSAMLGGDPEKGMSEALRILNSDDGVTLGANFAMIKTKDGKYTLGAAPDGTNLEPRPLPSNIFGEYDSPDKLFQAVRSVVDGKFTEFQNTIFNQQISLQEIGLRERAQKLSEDKFAFEKVDSNRRYGLAVKESNRPRGGGSSAGGGFTYTAATEQVPGAALGVTRRVLTPSTPGGVVMVEGPYGKFMPRRYADNPAALNDAMGAAMREGAVETMFNPVNGKLTYKRADGWVGTIGHYPVKKK